MSARNATEPVTVSSAHPEDSQAQPSTPKAKTTITGLPVLTEVLFRACVTQNQTGQGPWTAPVPFLVH